MGFTFEPLARRLLLLNHSEETVAGLEALVDEEKDKAAAFADPRHLIPAWATTRIGGNRWAAEYPSQWTGMPRGSL